MTDSRKTILRITFGFLVVQFCILLALLIRGLSQFIPHVAGVTLLLTLYTVLEFRCNVYIGRYERVLIMIVTVTDSFFGYYLQYYITSGIFDKIQHGFGTYACALFAYQVIVHWLRQLYSPVSTFIIVLALGISLGACYEVGEFLSDLLGNFENPVERSQPSLLDTNLDLICDILGALAAAYHAVRRKFSLLVTGSR